MTDPTTGVDAVAPPAAPAARTSSRRLHVVAGLRWLVARTIAIVFFMGGVALGYNAYLANQPTAPNIVDPATQGTDTPAVVRELMAALRSNDAAALRSATPPDPYQLLIAEMERWSFVTMTRVEALSTFLDGSRSATELVLTGSTTTGVPVSVNLVVHVDAGQIVSFR
jgi:hypothetical protein